MIIRCLLLLCFVGCFAMGHAQQGDKPVKIAVFAPMYVDSAFSNGVYKYSAGNMPRYMMPGLDFYNGVMMAIDSLNKENLPVTVVVYDSKSVDRPLQSIIDDTAMKDVSLIIASFNTRNDVKTLADFALQANIPLISSTYPNDAGVENNPYFVLINPTLRAHIEAIYRFLHRSYPAENMVLFKRKGEIEDMIQYLLLDMNRKTPGVPLKIKTVELIDSFSVNEVTDNLDSTKQNIVICGTLNEGFGSNLVKALGSNRNYKTITMGMPTWDGLRDISKDIEIVYTTPYNFIKNEKLNADLYTKYRNKYQGKASDMFFKGYESMFHFSKLLVKNRDAFMSHLSDKDFKVFNEYDIQPVRNSKEASQTDYLENKKVYFIRKVDGIVKSVN